VAGRRIVARTPERAEVGTATVATAVIEARAVGRRFDGRTALSGIDLRVHEGEIFGVLGPDGAGKTTLLQILAAILDPSEGSCRVLGFDTVREAAAVNARIGYMSQGFTLYERLTVGENLAFAARIRNVPPAVAAGRRERLLAMAGLEPYLDRREAQLSGGMRKKLALCTNLIHGPPLLLLDEPGLGVDPISRRELWRILQDFRRTGTTIVVTTSYMDEAGLCDRLAFLDRGRLIATGTPQQLLERGRGAVFEVASPAPAKVQALLASDPRVLGAQWRAERVRFQLSPSSGLPSDLQARLASLGSVEAATPTFEDIFTVLARSEEDTAAAGLRSTLPREPQAHAEGSVAVHELARRFGKFVAVDHVSFEVSPGEIFGFLGPNGAGKTTVIRMLCGLRAPSSGKARVAGADVGREARQLRGRIGYMSQSFSLYPDLAVGENLSFFASVYGLSGRAKRDAIAWAIRMTGLSGLEEQRVGSISPALRQRLALACSLLHRPAVIFLDEPTSGVDPPSRYRFWQLINTLAAAGMTVFVTTHYLEEAIYCQRLALMSDGRLIALGSLTELREALGEWPAETVEDVFIAYIARDRELRAGTAGAP
jgi:ABC-2 type transport system ATP-binding protein